MIARSTVLKPILRLSAAEFPKMAAKQFGLGDTIYDVWDRFAPVANTLVDSFWHTIDHPHPHDLHAWLSQHEPQVRGVAYEGAGMGLALLDVVQPRPQRLATFIAGPGHAFEPLLFIGAGMALPRPRVNPLRLIGGYESDNRWLILDGYGFYYGFFDPHRTLRRQNRPRHISGYPARVFDRGLGRSLWFTTAADPHRIAAVINTFPAHRRGDLWAGVALGCAYAAGVLEPGTIAEMVELAAPYQADLAVGVAAAADFRYRAACPAAHTDTACQVVWGMDAAALTAHLAAAPISTSPGPNDLSDIPAHEHRRHVIAAMWHARPANTPTSRSER
jgi:hypothetical protein